MGWLAKLFGGESRPSSEAQPMRRSAIETGFHWQRPGLPAVAAGRGFNQHVVGESFYREALERLAGGQTLHGVNVGKAAEIFVTDYNGAPAVGVAIDGERVGSIPAADVEAMCRELTSISASGRVSAKAQIVAGFEGGDYSVKISLARPLKLRSN